MTIAAAPFMPTDLQWHCLSQLRIHAGAPERSEKGIERLAQYYAQLLILEDLFPFETGKVNIQFTWHEALVPDKRVVTDCIQYEKAATLFNIGVTFAQLASMQRLRTADGKRKAAASFQKSASVFTFIRDALCQRFQVKLDKMSDLTDSCLALLSDVMLAQALECFYEKANHGRLRARKDAKGGVDEGRGRA
ncbi:Rhophilin, Rho GTPase binding protein, partial [Quaeritorhiza haematococci]